MAHPKTIGGVADRLLRLRNQRLDLQRKVDELKSGERELQEHGIKMLREQRLTAGRGKIATFSIKNQTVPKVVDWNAVYEYIVQYDAFELLQKRVNIAAWAEREVDGCSVPGTMPEQVVKVSLTKVSR